MAVGKVTGSFEFCLNNCGAKMCIFIKDLLYSHENVMTKILSLGQKYIHGSVKDEFNFF